MAVLSKSEEAIERMHPFKYSLDVLVSLSHSQMSHFYACTSRAPTRDGQWNVLNRSQSLRFLLLTLNYL